MIIITQKNNQEVIDHPPQTYSDDNQDIYVYTNFFSNLKNGFYVDLGAYDGITSSKTKMFEDLGWDGICVEPNPVVYQKLKQNRKCKCLNFGIGRENKDEPFVKLTRKDGESNNWEVASCFLEYVPVRLARMIIGGIGTNQTNCELIIIRSHTVTDLFNEYVIQKNINLLTVDVEGTENDIIKSIDYNKYLIDCIMLEYHDYTSDLDDFLITKDYYKVWEKNNDQIFIHKRINKNK